LCGRDARGSKAAVYRPDWVVVTKLRHALEHGASFFGFNEVKAHEFAERRIRYRAVDDRFQEAEPVIGFENVGRDYAVNLAGHNASQVPAAGTDH